MAKLDFNSKQEELQPLHEGKKSCCEEEEDLDSNGFEFEFEFRVQISESDKEMCAADDVFFKGQLLPLRSISFHSSAYHHHKQQKQQQQQQKHDLLISSHESSKCNSRSDSMDRFSSSSCYSRSVSNSSSSLVSETSCRSVSNKFYPGHPSPSPQIFTNSNNNKSKKINASWWGLFRVGLVKTPEIELEDLKQYRRTSAADENVDIKGKNREYGFLGCKCSTKSIETVSSRILITKKNKKIKKDGDGLIRTRLNGKSTPHARTFEWLEKL